MSLKASGFWVFIQDSETAASQRRAPGPVGARRGADCCSRSTPGKWVSPGRWPLVLAPHRFEHSRPRPRLRARASGRRGWRRVAHEALQRRHDRGGLGRGGRRCDELELGAAVGHTRQFDEDADAGAQTTPRTRAAGLCADVSLRTGNPQRKHAGPAAQNEMRRDAAASGCAAKALVPSALCPGRSTAFSQQPPGLSARACAFCWRSAVDRAG